MSSSPSCGNGNGVMFAVVDSDLSNGIPKPHAIKRNGSKQRGTMSDHNGIDHSLSRGRMSIIEQSNGTDDSEESPRHHASSLSHVGAAAAAQAAAAADKADTLLAKRLGRIVASALAESSRDQAAPAAFEASLGRVVSVALSRNSLAAASQHPNSRRFERLLGLVLAHAIAESTSIQV